MNKSLHFSAHFSLRGHLSRLLNHVHQNLFSDLCPNDVGNLNLNYATSINKKLYNRDLYNRDLAKIRIYDLP